MLQDLKAAGYTVEELNEFRTKLKLPNRPDSSFLCVPCHEEDGLDDALAALDVPVPEFAKPANSKTTGLGEVLEQILNF